MPRRKKTLLALPAQVGKDAKTVTKILDRWAVGVEDVLKDVFAWAKRHKMLVLLSIGAVAVWRYLLDEPVEKEDEEDEGY